MNRTATNEMHIFTISKALRVSLIAKYEIIRTIKGIKFCKVYTRPNGKTNTEYVSISQAGYPRNSLKVRSLSCLGFRLVNLSFMPLSSLLFLWENLKYTSLKSIWTNVVLVKISKAVRRGFLLLTSLEITKAKVNVTMLATMQMSPWRLRFSFSVLICWSAGIAPIS